MAADGEVDSHLSQQVNSLSLNMDSFSLTQLEFLRTVGTGSFGRVMLVRNQQSDKIFALKMLAIEDVVRLNQVDHVKNEKSVLNLIDHPFLISLFWTGHDSTYLYMLFEYVCGGELFTYLRTAKKFSSVQTKFFTAEIVSGLVYLHSKCIVYRDIKPENILLDIKGHVKIADFGFAKVLKDRTYTMCGTPEYLAPEIILGKGYNKAVDWWALGILCFEMLTGRPPFIDSTPILIYHKILSGQYEFAAIDSGIDSNAKDLIKKLLVSDRAKRLGNMKGGSDDVLAHRWFKNLNWQDVVTGKLVPAIVPYVNGPADTRCYNTYRELDFQNLASSSTENEEIFKDF